ncbi:lipocalin family protein [Flagellimonas hymeniacidonis]|uniref:Lipocalin family protein n=1 Tax=Flagellimonas hymeniacidonis TaxID=2603628 RepID=A0A5C8V9P6_9FLAO|nr:lipocalin family protein [Flagellimonas hymeniacidonis]TXN38083.1 lipocalin family protein [Flagellimonas hymeniacidonis]
MKKLGVLLITVLLFTSCSSDDDTVADSGLNGTWTLTRVSCFCGFADPPEFDLTQLTFDADTNEIIVLNNGDQVYFRENGTYSYTGNGSRIRLEDGKFYDFEITGDTLSLVFVDEPMIADDEVSYSFVRN